MNLERRAFLTGAGALALAQAMQVRAQAQDSQSLPLPNKARFESGDLLWPKKPGVYVPYRSAERTSIEEERERWNSERDAFIASRKVDPRYFTPADVEAIRTLNYREFYARYAGDQKPGVPGVYSGSGVYVGHVGILQIEEKEQWVIEAIGTGVQRVKYAEWIKQRPGEIVWHGRIAELSISNREKIAIESKRYIGRPYDFWNFDLEDDSGFYCSKLVWLSVWRSIGLPLDGNANSKRTFWLSPKQLLYSSRIIRLHDPGSYANL